MDLKKQKHYNTPGHAHSLTYSCYHNRSYFDSPIPCQLFLRELAQAQQEYNFHIWAYVVMPNHVHLLLFPLNAEYSITKINKAIKGRMARAYGAYLKEYYPQQYMNHTILFKNKPVFRFWQKGGGFDRNLWNEEIIHNTLHYIENNPVRKGNVSHRSLWKWSSAFTGIDDVVRPIITRSSLPVLLS